MDKIFYNGCIRTLDDGEFVDSHLQALHYAFVENSILFDCKTDFETGLINTSYTWKTMMDIADL